MDLVAGLASDSRVVAIGETGLDRYWDAAPLELQQDFFRRHIELSRRVDKPFIVHCREAEADVVALLQEESRNGPLRGVMHSFCGTLETANACLDLGLSLSFAGMLTFKNNQALRDVARQIPLDRVLVETDSPYLAPVPMRGKRNEPGHVVHTARCLAELHQISLEELCVRTTANVRQLFALS
jgi:TatD DNase family protein